MKKHGDGGDDYDNGDENEDDIESPYEDSDDNNTKIKATTVNKDTASQRSARIILKTRTLLFLSQPLIYLFIFFCLPFLPRLLPPFRTDP